MYIYRLTHFFHINIRGIGENRMYINTIVLIDANQMQESIDKII